MKLSTYFEDTTLGCPRLPLSQPVFVRLIDSDRKVGHHVPVRSVSDRRLSAEASCQDHSVVRFCAKAFPLRSGGLPAEEPCGVNLFVACAADATTPTPCACGARRWPPLFRVAFLTSLTKVKLLSCLDPRRSSG
jgi:hypothetical protein